MNPKSLKYKTDCHLKMSLKVGPYILGQTLGTGSFGKVILGEHEKCRQKVAVKILNRKKIYFMGMNLKVKREIQKIIINKGTHHAI